MAAGALCRLFSGSEPLSARPVATRGAGLPSRTRSRAGRSGRAARPERPGDAGNRQGVWRAGVPARVAAVSPDPPRAAQHARLLASAHTCPARPRASFTPRLGVLGALTRFLSGLQAVRTPVQRCRVLGPRGHHLRAQLRPGPLCHRCDPHQRPGQRARAPQPHGGPGAASSPQRLPAPSPPPAIRGAAGPRARPVVPR